MRHLSHLPSVEQLGHFWFTPEIPPDYLARARAGATYAVFARHLVEKFQSTPPARGATTAASGQMHLAIVSIHAPRAGGDYCGVWSDAPCHRFNPRPRAGGDRLRRYHQVATAASFNPRPRAGGDMLPQYKFPWFQSMPPRGGRREAEELCPVGSISSPDVWLGTSQCLRIKSEYRPHLSPDSPDGVESLVT